MTTLEWDAATYHRISDPQFGWGSKLLDRIALRGDEAVLDVGCGSGRLTAELLRRLPRGQVVGLDFSENMLHQARQNLAEFSGRILLVLADAARIPFAARFDGVFSNAAFHWVKDHPRLFRSVFAALKPGGWLEAQCGGGPNLDQLHRRALDLMAKPRLAPFFADWSNPWEFSSPEAAAERLRAAGFVAVKAWLESTPMSWPDATVYKEYLATVVLRTYLARIPDADLRADFLDELARLDPTFTLDYWRLNLSARKPA
jgi:trans-aconitate methyltransferase